VAVDLGDVDHLDLHGLFRLALAFAPDHPGVHLLGQVSEGRNLADFVEVLLVLERALLGGGDLSHDPLSQKACPRERSHGTWRRRTVPGLSTGKLEASASGHVRLV
jgi:hypothetical protein